MTEKNKIKLAQMYRIHHDNARRVESSKPVVKVKLARTQKDWSELLEIARKNRNVHE